MRILKAALPLVVMLASFAEVQAQTVQTTLNYPIGVNGVAVDFGANRAYVLLPNYFANGTNGVQVLDGSNNTVITTFGAPVANAIAVNVATGTVYVGGSIPSSTNPSGIESVVSALNPKTGAVTATIPITANNGSGIVALAVDPVTNRVFVSNASDNTIAVINGKTNVVTASLSLNGQTPAGLGVNFLTGKVYAALNDNQVAILTEKTNALTYATYGSQTSGIAVDPFKNQEYVTDGVFDVPTVGVLSSTGATVASIPVGLFPQGIDVDFVTEYVFVANEADGTLSKIDADSNTVVSTVSVAANSVAVNPREATVYAVGSTSVTVLTEN